MTSEDAGAPVPPEPPPRRTAWYPVPDYPGYQIYLWTNSPGYLEAAISGVDGPSIPAQSSYENEAGEVDARAYLAALKVWTVAREESMCRALSRVVLKHNGWRDVEPPDGTGTPLPQPSDPEFWERIPQELVRAILATRRQAMADLSTSLRRR